jgi:hypothetical protein
MKRIVVTTKQLNEIASFDRYNAKELRKVQHNIYKSVSDFCGKMHKDDAWQDVKTLIDIISSVNGVEDVNVGAGVYSNYTNPEKGACRDYKTTVITSFGNLYGYIRCHAAGTMDDVFKYYDMTISLYPNKENDMNGGEVNEENNVNVSLNTNGNTIPSVVSTIDQNMPKINQASKTGDPIIHISNPSSQNGTNDEQFTQHVEVGRGQTIQQAAQSQLNPSATNNGGDIEISGPGIQEGKSYTKRDIERARLAKIRAEGKVMTKKQLKESLMK